MKDGKKTLAYWKEIGKSSLFCDVVEQLHLQPLPRSRAPPEFPQEAARSNLALSPQAATRDQREPTWHCHGGGFVFRFRTRVGFCCTSAFLFRGEGTVRETDLGGNDACSTNPERKMLVMEDRRSSQWRDAPERTWRCLRKAEKCSFQGNEWFLLRERRDEWPCHFVNGQDLGIRWVFVVVSHFLKAAFAAKRHAGVILRWCETSVPHDHWKSCFTHVIKAVTFSFKSQDLSPVWRTFQRTRKHKKALSVLDFLCTKRAFVFIQKPKLYGFCLVGVGKKTQVSPSPLKARDVWNRNTSLPLTFKRSDWWYFLWLLIQLEGRRVSWNCLLCSSTATHGKPSS